MSQYFDQQDSFDKILHAHYIKKLTFPTLRKLTFSSTFTLLLHFPSEQFFFTFFVINVTNSNCKVALIFFTGLITSSAILEWCWNLCTCLTLATEGCWKIKDPTETNFERAHFTRWSLSQIRSPPEASQTKKKLLGWRSSGEAAGCIANVQE